MTCKDCLYSPICKIYSDFGVTDVLYDENYTCEIFKSKSDLIEVVRCKDCGMSRETEDERYLFCMQFADTVGFRAFCSYGVRKEGADNG